jgi:hypothetical protein
MKKKIAVLGSMLATAFAMSTPAIAGVVFENGNNPQQKPEENILFNGPGTNTTGPTVIGRTNQSNVLVSFQSNEALIASANGQADLKAADGGFKLLDIYLTDGGTFGDLIFNLKAGVGDSGVALVTVNLLGGGTQTYDLGVDNGQNFLTIYATDTDRITSVNINSDTDVTAVEITDGKQFRISEVQGTSVPVPEPGTLALLGVGLLGIQRLRRKYHN